MSNYLVNLVTDPACTDPTQATAVGGAVIAADNSWSADGQSGSYHVSGSSASYGVGWTVTMDQPGTECTFALNVRAGATATTGLTLQIDAAGQSFGLNVPDLAAYDSERVALTFTVPDATAEATFEVLAPSTTPEFWVDMVVVAMTDADPGQLDGSTPKIVNADRSSYVFVWQGTKNASRSVRYVMQEILPVSTAYVATSESPVAAKERWVTSYAIADAATPNGMLLDGVTAASLAYDWFSATKATLTFSVLRHPNLSGYYADWATASIIPSKVETDGTAKQLGVFVVTDVAEAVGADGSYILNVTAGDRTVLLSGNVWMDSAGNPATASFGSGSNLLEIINAILACASCPPIKNADSVTAAATLVNDFTYPVGTDLLTMANDLLQNTGFRALSVKADGTFFISPVTSLSLRTTQWTHSGSMGDKDGSMRSPAFGITRNLFGVPNKVVCVSTQFGDSSLGLDFVSVATDTNPASPFSYIPNPDPTQPPIRGWRTKVFSGIAVDTQEALDTIAKQYLAQLQGQSRTATVSHLYMADFDPGTSVLFSDSTSGQASGDAVETPDSFLSIVSAQTIDLIGMGVTSSTLLEITAGVTDWNSGGSTTLGQDNSDQYITS